MLGAGVDVNAMLIIRASRLVFHAEHLQQPRELEHHMMKI